MAFPHYKDIEEPLLCLIYFNGGASYQMKSGDTYKPLADYFKLSQQEMETGRLFNDNRYESEWNNRVQWARNELKKAIYLDKTARGIWKLSTLGIATAQSISNKYQLLNFVSNHEIAYARETEVGKGDKKLQEITQSDLDALLNEEEYFEGGQTKRFTNHYERNPKLRSAAISFHGTKCKVCSFDFEMMYGEHGAGFIEVHHLIPVSDLKEETKIDPKTDMTVICSNCHRMIHREKDKVLSIDELKAIFQKQE